MVVRPPMDPASGGVKSMNTPRNEAKNVADNIPEPVLPLAVKKSSMVSIFPLLYRTPMIVNPRTVNIIKVIILEYEIIVFHLLLLQHGEGSPLSHFSLYSYL